MNPGSESVTEGTKLANLPMKKPMSVVRKASKRKGGMDSKVAKNKEPEKDEIAFSRKRVSAGNSLLIDQRGKSTVVETNGVPAKKDSNPPKKPRRTTQTTKRLNDEWISNKPINAAVLCVKPNRIPDLYAILLNSLKHDERKCLRSYDVQTDLINLATEERFFQDENPEESIISEMIGKIRNEGAYLAVLPKDEDQQISQINDVLARYDAFHHSPSEVEKRQFMRGKHKWTEEEKKRYAEAFVKYSRDQKGNKRIAEYVGNGVSPQQCTEYRTILKKSGQLDALKAKALQYAQEMALKRKKKVKV